MSTNIPHVSEQYIPTGEYIDRGIDIESLYFNPAESGQLGRSIKERVDNAKNIVVECEGTRLEINSEMEPSLLNIGDYEGIK